MALYSAAKSPKNILLGKHIHKEKVLTCAGVRPFSPLHGKNFACEAKHGNVKKNRTTRPSTSKGMGDQ